MDPLFQQLSLPDPPFTVAAVGSGGKTTCLKALYHACIRDGVPVLLTTTTHMRRETECLLSPDIRALRAALLARGHLFAGTPAAEGKLGPLPPEIFAPLSRLAQVTLVEADGSRGLPLKMPAPYEPVLPPETAHVLVLAGLSGLGQPLGCVCHRWEIAAERLGLRHDTAVTPELAAQLIRTGYLDPLRATHPGLRITVVLHQSDCARPEEIARFGGALGAVRWTALALGQTQAAAI